MSDKTKNILKWVLGGLIAALFIFSGIGKFFAEGDNLKQAEAMGLTAANLKILGGVEIFAALLFLNPKTGLVGTFLLMAYMGGAICAHLLSGEDLTPVIVIEILIWLIAAFRFPELTQRLRS